MRETAQIQLNPKFLSEMHTNFDEINQRFKIIQTR